ncbi:MAG: PaaI family thioesterase [bacterium]
MSKPLQTSELPQFPNCFVCGSENPKGLHVRFCTTPEGVEAIFQAEPSHAGYEDVVHGGIVGALLDEAMIWASYVSMRRFGVTAELNVRYIKPLRVRQTCTLIGRFVEDRGKLWIAEGEMIDEEGKPIARARGKILPTDKK